LLYDKVRIIDTALSGEGITPAGTIAVERLDKPCRLPQVSKCRLTPCNPTFQAFARGL
jgi:hypothetical protein